MYKGRKRSNSVQFSYLSVNPNFILGGSEGPSGWVGGKIYTKLSLGINWIPSTYFLPGAFIHGKELALFRTPENASYGSSNGFWVEWDRELPCTEASCFRSCLCPALCLLTACSENYLVGQWRQHIC